MSVLNENTIIGASAAGEYEIEQSLRFDDGRGTYLSRTTGTWTDGKKYTLSMWVKRATLSTVQSLLTNDKTSSGNTGFTFLKFETNNKLYMYFHSSAGSSDWYSDAVFRDTSAWYHIVHIFDSANSTAADRGQVYVNGTRLTSAAGFDTAIPLNFVPEFTESPSMFLGINGAEGSYNQGFDGYLAEVNFIDGQALTPDNFGETGDYNEWKPIEYAGTYGNNGFYLPFKQDYTVEGFSTVVYEGNGASSHYIGGTGFTPDLVWIKERTDNGSHQLIDSVRGVTKRLESNGTGAETAISNGLLSFEPDGFTYGDYSNGNENGIDNVAWCWDMGGTTASNTNGSITSSVRANTTYGQSIVKWTSTGGANTIEHGLSQAPDMIIAKPTNDTDQWVVYTSALGNTKMMGLNYTTAETTNSIFWNNTTPSSSVFTTGSWFAARQFIAYCFHSVTGYSSFGSYSGTGSSGNAITTGFAPAFVMVKRSSGVGSWGMYDNTRNQSNSVTSALFANLSDAESVETSVEFTSTSFIVNATGTAMNGSGDTYIYMAFADTREYAYWYDQSGNNNDWTSEGGLTESDVMVDSPTNNFATFNPLVAGGVDVLSEGNLKFVGGASSQRSYRPSTTGIDSGKFYFEGLALASSGGFSLGICIEGGITDDSMGKDDFSWSYDQGGTIRHNNSAVSYGASYAVGDIISAAVDIDNGTIVFSKNGASQGSYNIAGFSTSDTYFLGVGDGTAASSTQWVINFGADSSFAGNKTPQGNSDSSGIGDFYYAPPTGFLALCTANLPSVDVIPSENFNTVLYTGTGSSNAISNLGLTPDFTWIKSRSNTEGHGLVDSVRGATKLLSSNTTDSEATSANYVASLDSDGFTVGTSTLTNGNGYTYVAWNWKLGGSAVSNSNGSATSQVLANVDAGISIATFTLPTTATTIGHGLSKAPELIFQKGRASGSAWWTFAKPIGNTKALRLDSTTSSVTSQNFWNNTDPTSTVVTIGANSGANNSWMMYCFHSVDGYSKVGSYTGNGSTDGPFVHCGFKVAMIIQKRTDGADSWHILDNKRSPSNVVDDRLYPNLSSAESTSGDRVDFTSNGFKVRTSNGDFNASGGTYIFYAVAENPFKHTNAR